MDIFNRKEIVNFKLLGNLIVELTYNDGSQSTYSNVLWSVNGDGDGSGTIHLSQGGAVGGIGFFGYRVSQETPLIVNGESMTEIGLVELYMINNLSESSTTEGNYVEIVTDSSIASNLNEGKLKYYLIGNNSYVDICMKTGLSEYTWVNITQNNW